MSVEGREGHLGIENRYVKVSTGRALYPLNDKRSWHLGEGRRWPYRLEGLAWSY